ncbi:precorrin-2 C(20)-methyltransferase [Candidatus Magnetaquicoccus inordinatus]|uniref:precorrin-2 C(20)-methyltransferase n=1 Tax=Candidatus Magnetaquicoccus inordinatus TaxID=2496818 RepID=UPI00102CFA0A|nr:precorrin-2 C(20)-methyltransferase [Candidatus Magnetaquicoccus inordinatus]
MTHFDSTTPGRLYATSLGPGDPELITRRAWRILQTASCWAWPESRQEGGGYALAIAERAGLSLPAHTLPLSFPMTRDLTILAKHWQMAAQQVLQKLQQGEDVVFLVEGDASFFSTFGHLQRTVQALDARIVVEIIPGVASPMAAAALTQQSLGDGDQTLALVPATVGMERIEQLLEDFHTLVLLKVRPVLEDLLDLLARKQLLGKARFIERAGAPEERVVSDVTTLRGCSVHYLSLMIIHCHDGEANLGNRG